jgi:hypothetical protein
MEGESSEGTRRNVAKSFSPCWIAQQKKPQFYPTTRRKGDKSARLSGNKALDDLTNQEDYEISSISQGTGIIEIEPKLTGKFLQCTNKRKLKLTTAIAYQVLPFIFPELNRKAITQR